jgi:membrane protease YdiL (CAAX protease family)
MIAAGAVGSAFPVSESARSAVKALVSLPLPMRSLLVMTAGICEDFLFRGFGIAALTRLIGTAGCRDYCRWPLLRLHMQEYMAGTPAF